LRLRRTSRRAAAGPAGPHPPSPAGHRHTRRGDRRPYDAGPDVSRRRRHPDATGKRSRSWVWPMAAAHPSPGPVIVCTARNPSRAPAATL